MQLVLVHPPLLAPVVFSRLAPLLREGGHDVAVPDLRRAVTAGPAAAWWQRAVDLAAGATPHAQGVLAHSGAGALVPAPPGWEPPARFYLRLSPACTDAAGGAAARGWRVEHHDGRHLDVLTRADTVAAAVRRLLPA